MSPSPLNIALFGYGKMGRLIESVAASRGHHVVAILDPADATGNLSLATIAIDFSTALAVPQNIATCAEAKIPLVVGTTGWLNELAPAQKKVAATNSSLLYAPNFSLGVYLFQKLVRQAASLVAELPDYDIWGLELHHHEKADSPSGTALKLSEEILAAAPRKKKVVYDRLNRKITPDELHFASVRGGTSNFMHEIGIGSAVDTITLRHEAHDRSGYALGAVLAAEWLVTQPPRWYEFSEFAEQLITKHHGGT